MNTKKPLVLAAVVAIAALLVFMVDAYEKQATDEKVLKLQIETTKETADGDVVTETEDIVIYDQDDVEQIEEQLRALGYIE